MCSFQNIHANEIGYEIIAQTFYDFAGNTYFKTTKKTYNETRQPINLVNQIKGVGLKRLTPFLLMFR